MFVFLEILESPFKLRLFYYKKTEMLDHKTGLILVGLSLGLLMLFTYGIFRYYKEKSVSFLYSSTIYITWFFILIRLIVRVLGFVGIILYPIDIGYCIEEQVANSKLLTIWTVVYWVTFFLAWVYIPIMMEYWASGEFKRSYRIVLSITCRFRFREALWVNAKFYIIVVIVAAVAGVWFLFSGSMY